ncbi:putative nuclease HARBI1 isoform X1 [Ixodes scapularis]
MDADGDGPGVGDSKDVCGRCTAPYYGRQQFFLCAGPCKRRFHCKCINVVEEDYEYLMADGMSSYKCPSCAKPLDKSGNKVSDDSAAILLEETELSPANVIPGTDTSLPELVVLLCKKIDDLTKAVKTLMTDNESLRIHLSRNCELLHKLCMPEEQPVAPAVPQKHYAAVLKKLVPFVSHHVNSAANDDRSRATERSPFMEDDDVAANSQHTRASLVDDERFTTVTRKKRPLPTEGDCDSSYIGDTGRKKITRMKEHQRDVKYSTNATRLKTELVDHAWTTGHTFDFTAATTLAKEYRLHREHRDAFELPEEIFRKQYRLPKIVVRWLCDELREEPEVRRVRTSWTVMTVELQVLCALRFYGTGSFQGMVASDEHVARDQKTVSVAVRAVSVAIVRRLGVQRGWIHFPETPSERFDAEKGFRLLGRIPGVIGCVDGTMVSIVGPSKNDPTVTKAAYWCRKYFYALNVMVVCDADCRIMCIDPRYPGSVHDSFVWQFSWLRNQLEQGQLPRDGRFLLGDSGYPLEPWLITPVPGNHATSTACGRFNKAHSSISAPQHLPCIERARTGVRLRP